jgi:selenocysteine lyase/cysteine desulfurase
MNIADARALFPITKKYTYLNHAAVTPHPTPVAEAMTEFIADMRDEGSANVERWMQRVEEVRGLAARLIGAAAEEIAFTRNTSHGLLLVANGIDWRGGDNIITAQGEFPANVYPWVLLKRLGVETRFAPAHDGRILIDDLTRLIDSKTRLVALSFVEFDTGFRNDLAAIGQLCRERGVYLCVDGIQGLGAIPLDVSKVPIDFLSAGAPKWLMGPIGSGFFYCRCDLIDRLIPAFAGWQSVIDREEY